MSTAGENKNQENKNQENETDEKTKTTYATRPQHPNIYTNNQTRSTHHQTYTHNIATNNP
eukprot:scaffold134376_cov45-Attheya_sp.AAC.3